MNYNCDVKIIDQLMGCGKTSSAINMIKQSIETPSDIPEHFLFITPYIEEIKRIQSELPMFKTPRGITGSKLGDIKRLVENGNNIVSTHALFQRYDQEMIDLCRARNYTLIMDEVTEVIEPYELTDEDFKLLKERFVDIDSSGFLHWKPEANDYNGKFSKEKHLCEMKCLVHYGGSVMMWLFPIEVFNAFRKIYILTYLFNSQVQKYYYDYYKLPYSYMWVAGNSIEEYHFVDDQSIATDPRKDFKNLIHILDDERMNSIGDREYDLSKRWYQRNAANAAGKQLKNNLITYFLRRRSAKSSECIWTTFKDYRDKITSKGFGRAFIPLNIRASNQYKSRTSIAYPVNRYLNTGVKNFFLQNCVNVDEDGFALSEMLQFIWRGAIREGKEIWIYIPSVRMRTLLQQWINENSKEETQNE